MENRAQDSCKHQERTEVFFLGEVLCATDWGFIIGVQREKKTDEKNTASLCCWRSVCHRSSSQSVLLNPWSLTLWLHTRDGGRDHILCGINHGMLKHTWTYTCSGTQSKVALPFQQRQEHWWFHSAWRCKKFAVVGFTVNSKFHLSCLCTLWNWNNLSQRWTRADDNDNVINMTQISYFASLTAARAPWIPNCVEPTVFLPQ